MTPNGDSFLPRIQSVFYAIFDVRQGPKIIFQVPEALIAVSNQGITASSSTLSFSSLTGLEQNLRSDPTSRASSVSIPSNHRLSFSFNSPNKRSFSTSNPRYLFHFDDVSKFVIPPSPLCGRLVTCSTKDHRIIGFPVELLGKYERNYFRYNLCFVFERQADLSCYEPIVRKIARVFTACEEESAFLSSPSSPVAMLAILEQLYEDLNSYSETSIPIDAFNSLELKIFPFYPNPSPVKDWDVPLALINLAKRIEPNWDLTIGKVIKHIDGVNHVSRIAYLADCDLDLTREAISHLLYYQVIMTIDIFQYSNMYTLRKSIQWLADEQHVRDECGLYVTKPGRGKRISDFPKLLHLYSRLKPGKSVYEWAHDHDVINLGIDVRRFVSFGVIKGFLRRIHRYPILIKPSPPPGQINGARHNRNASSGSLGRKRGKTMLNSPTWTSTQSQPQSQPQTESDRGKVPKAPPTLASINTELAVSARNSSISPLADSASASVVNFVDSADRRCRGVRSPVQILLRQQQEKEKELSEAEKSLEKLKSHTHGLMTARNKSTVAERSKERQQGDRAEAQKSRLSKGITGSAFWSATLALSGSTLGTGPTAPRGLGVASVNVERESMGGPQAAASTRLHRSPSVPSGSRAAGLKRSPSMPPIQAPVPIQSASSSSPTTMLSQSQPRTRSASQRFANAVNVSSSTSNPSGPLSHSTSQSAFPPYPKDLLELLDGEHHSDELGTKFEVGWPMLEAWLAVIPESEGRVEVIYR
ncbi:NPR2-domain-containing protein [Neolentinus lepideus HHB14362 ss-1]|uniref:NPR2-domain-containing protein n=1 Tax=Neolentinus lepideus HHB14362 ss-1 TaxID=1314782 RepID=A0A165TAW2_9AGAM|nr:NPR2-domain-containing protein [Neolentinus lepideus HHB14362 ss-1]